MLEKKKLNSIIANILSFGIQMFISFFVTPIILEKVGTDAYGFIGQANDFVAYLSVITSILNSVAGRFIAVAIDKGDEEKASIYFNSVMVFNIIFSFVIVVLGGVFITNIDVFLNIPPNLVNDVKLTFVFTLMAYVINILISLYTASTFIKDRLDIQGVRNIIQYALRGGLVIIVFMVFRPRIYLLSLITMIVTVIVSVIDYGVYKRIMPELKVNIRNYKFSAVKELAASGSLLAITSLSSILLAGLDLLIANRVLGAYEMGLLSAAKTIPNSITSAVIVVGALFTPNFINLYSTGRIERLVQEVDKSMQIIALIFLVPLTGFLVFSKDFYSLWLSGKSVREIAIVAVLSNITVLEIFFNALTYPMAQLNLVTNKMKLPVFISISLGVANTVIVLLLLEFTDIGLYAIASVSTILLILRYILFNPGYAAKVLGIRMKTFYASSLKLYLLLPLIYFAISVSKGMFDINSWKELVISAVICGGIAYLVLAAGIYVSRRVFKRNGEKDV